MRTVIAMILPLLLFACKKDSCRHTQLQHQQVTLQVVRLEQALYATASQAEVEDFLDEHASFSEFFLYSKEYPNHQVLAGKLNSLIRNPAIDTLVQEAQSVFGDFAETKSVLTDAFGRMKTIFPDMSTPKIQTCVTGLFNDLYISDSLIIVGLDYFIGPTASYRPQDIPNYILNRYDPAHLPVTIVKFLAGPQVATGKGETLLSEMIDFGKIYYLMGQLMPCTTDSVLIGYTSAEMENILDNEAIIWANFVENEILYETSHITKRKFLSERPNVYEISKKCPGRIGAWVGWRIVQAYMEKSGSTVRDLIRETDHNKIFQLSGYKPKG